MLIIASLLKSCYIFIIIILIVLHRHNIPKFLLFLGPNSSLLGLVYSLATLDIVSTLPCMVFLNPAQISLSRSLMEKTKPTS